MNLSLLNNFKNSRLRNSFLFSKEMMLFYVLLLIVGFTTIINPVFLTTSNLLSILKQITIVVIVAIGQTFIISSGGIDLSVGYVMAVSSIVFATLLKIGIPITPAILLGISSSTLLGALNGLMVTKLRLPPFIITFGMANIAKGIVLVVTQSYVIQLNNPFITFVGVEDFLGIPVMAYFVPVFVLIGWFLLNKTVFGSHVLAIGGNETAARLSGIPVHKIKIWVYTLTGIFCGVAGILITARLNGGNPNAGLTTDMDTIGAVIVGGTALSGGSGTVIGSFIGALLMGVIRNGLVLMNVDLFWQTIVTGTIVISVCAIKEILKRKEN
ncbi:MAG: ABC transporter permease [Anaerolineae bacterium]|nr:ABC transporter permease [Anaerolineae bacterium]